MFGSSFKDSPAPPVNIPGTGELRAKFRTSMGDIEVKLLEKECPRTVANFVALATGGLEWTDPSGRKRTDALYTGTIFHRVIPDFMIQGGDPAGTGMGGPGFKWGEEPSALQIKHDRPGVLAMARTQAPSSQGCQFYLTEKATPWLDGGYSAFGYVIANAELIAQIARVPRNQADKPLTPVKLLGVDVYRAA